ncbi:hypothetical protein [Paenibacillus sp. EPM92]|uniref:hypothetical protein n=1 Tax=Paenibacillus sp. EPM92 TaxID=1561195 RepID=UPI001916991C|nr:hypothetical protein [Paenibacillus sp. EPM92]
MADVNSIMRADARQVFAKVEVTFNDSFIDTSLAASATQNGRFTFVDQVKNEYDTPDYKYFSLHNNKLDGTFHPLPSTPQEAEVGWWGTTLSDASGVVSPAPIITMTFNARAIYTLKVVGDSLLNDFPVDFTFKLYNASNAVVYTETVTGNTLVSWLKEIPGGIGNITKVELTITRINKAGSVPKVLECYTGVKETYDADRLIDIDLLEEQVFDDSTLPIGNVSSNEIDIRLDNTDKHFDPRNSSSPLYGQLKKNRKVKPFLGVDQNGDGNITYYPLGVFYTTEWRAPTNEIYAELTARDRLELMRQKDFTKSQVYINQNLYDMAEIVFQDFGLSSREYWIDPALKSIIVPYMWFDRVSHREALSQIAEAGLARLYCARNGIVRLETQRTTGAAIFDFRDDETIFNADYPLAGGQTTNYVEVESLPRAPGPVETILQSSDVLSIPAGGTLKQVYKFNFIPCVNVSSPLVSSDAGVSVVSHEVYAWGMEITYSNANASSANVTAVTVSGQKLDVAGASVATSQDAASIEENGKLVQNISNDFIQTIDRAQQISASILAAYKDPRHDIDMDTRGHVSLQLGDKITAPGFDQGTTAEYYIVRQNVNWDGALSAKIKGLKA